MTTKNCFIRSIDVKPPIRYQYVIVLYFISHIVSCSIDFWKDLFAVNSLRATGEYDFFVVSSIIISETYFNITESRLYRRRRRKYKINECRHDVLLKRVPKKKQNTIFYW